MKTPIHGMKRGARLLLAGSLLALSSALALTRVARADDGYVDYQKVLDFYDNLTRRTEPAAEVAAPMTPGKKQMAYVKPTRSPRVMEVRRAEQRKKGGRGAGNG